MKNLRELLTFALALLPMLGSAHQNHAGELEEEGKVEFAAITLELPEELGDSVKIPVMRDGALHVLKLQKFSCRGENFRVLAADENGELVEISAPPVCTYRGVVLGDRDSKVSGAITQRGVSMRVVCGDGECWEIRPPEKNGGTHKARSITMREQLGEMLHAFEGSDAEVLFSTLALPRSVTVKEAEEFVAVKLNSFVISNALVEHVVGTIVLRKSREEDPYDGMTDAYAILPRMRNVWNGSGNTGFPRPSTTHDLATLLVGRGIGVAGLGYVGTINEGSRYTLGTTTSGSGVGFWFNGICKHEVAHNWGLGHGGCGDEKRPQGDDFTWSMCGGYHDRMRTDEAARAISERDSSNLRDIGTYTAANVPPYCPKDTANVSIGEAPVRLDVQRNDYDANNHEFQIERLTVGTTETATTSEGATISISAGTGPGGRDEVLYTPPSTGTPGAIDKFYYHVRDTGGNGAFGQVKVTLQPSTKPKEVNPASYLADTALDFSNEQNPTTRQNTEDETEEIWSYGSFVGGSTRLTLATGHQVDGGNIVGEENNGWVGSGAVRIHKHAVLPSADDGDPAVRRWRSNYSGEVAVLYDAKRLNTDGDGLRASIRHNGTEIWGDTLNNSDPHAAGTVFVEIAEGDLLDFAIDGNGSRGGDWTHFTGRVVKAQQVKWHGADRPAIHYKFDAAGTFPPERKKVVADYSGNKNHAALTGFDVNNAHIAAQIENGLIFDGTDDEIITREPAALQGATELTISAWVKPDTLGDNRGIVTSLNDTDQNASYFGLLIGTGADGHPAQFRAHRGPVNGASGSIPVGRWSHLVGVWKAGEVQKLYIDGIEVGDNPSPSSVPFDTDHWVSGRDRAQGGRWFDGSMDDVAIWARALSADEVSALHTNGRDGKHYDGNGQHDRIDSPRYADGAYEATLSAWVRAGSLAEHRGILATWTEDDFPGNSFERSYFALSIGSSEDGLPAQFRAHRWVTQGLPGSFPVGSWVHVAGVWKAGIEQSMYIDGVKVSEHPNPSESQIDIGGWHAMS